ncbi:MAG: DUF5009 domain-containing protein [Candidatus Hinthialibacter antarcticus]|nr:DUF5009 domain-containing protein [Candidatus Hinthialibacter antarcticus]
MPEPTIVQKPQRLASLDAYRGIVMFLMVAEVLHLSRIAGYFPNSWFWNTLSFHQSHVEWVGCSLHDLIQPSFSFMVGVALPFSIASRLKKEQSWLQMNLHAVWRAVLLISIGIFLRSLHSSQTYFTFEDTLTQIGLGYWFLFLLGFTSLRAQIGVLGALLFGYWLAFALYPLPPAGFDTTSVGVPADWSHQLSGFAAHWNKNTNFAAGFEQWFLNLFPRENPFVYNGGGYLTLSFIPTLGTMILGLLAGQIVKKEASHQSKVGALVSIGFACLALGVLLHAFGLCPIVKRIWTPAWTLFSGGWCFLFLAFLYQLIDVWGTKSWSFVFLIFGMNSITLYCMSWLMEDFIHEAFQRHLGHGVFLIFGEPYQTLVSGFAVLAVFWLILFWMYRNKYLIRI